ncbi:MAG: acyltransferase family protein [Bacteroidales bacterium]|nr:acyltransferase family protein [Bacteroidales bacterium]
MSFDGMLPGLKTILSFGQMGCQAFFLLSAYCLCLSNSGKKIEVLPFLKKRFLSLAPTYWSTMIIGFIVYWISIRFLGHVTLKLDPEPVYVALNISLLHGVLPLYKPMNAVVCGGWFVGTLMVLYCLYPLLSKVYFYEKNRLWREYRWLLFPSAITLVCWALIGISGYGQESYCILGSAKYFHFLNQLPSFVIGFSLYDLSRDTRIRFYLPKAAAFLVLTYLVFVLKFKASYMIAPVTISIVSVYLFLAIEQNQNWIAGKAGSFISRLGDSSFSIYLSHFWIVYTFVYFLQHTCGFLSGVGPTMRYLLYLPILLVVIYFVSRAYAKWIDYLNGNVKKLIK